MKRNCCLSIGLVAAVLSAVGIGGALTEADAAMVWLDDAPAPADLWAKAQELVAGLGEREQKQVRITVYWNHAIWQGVGSRYPNDWNRNVMKLPRASVPAYLAADLIGRIELIRSVPTEGVPKELVEVAGELADAYETTVETIVARMTGEGDAAINEEEMPAVERKLETLRLRLNREYGLDLVEVSLVSG